MEADFFVASRISLSFHSPTFPFSAIDDPFLLLKSLLLHFLLLSIQHCKELGFMYSQGFGAVSGESA